MPVLIILFLLMGWGVAIALLLLVLQSRLRVKQLDSDRSQSYDRLRTSEERLQLALDAANQGIWDWDLKTQVLTWDDRCKEIFGLPADFSVTYEWHLNALHPDDRQRVLDAVAVALRDRTDFDQEYRTFHPDGSLHWVMARGRGYYDAAGQPYRMSGIVLDMTARQQTAIALQQKDREAEAGQQVLNALLEYIPEGITIADAPDVVIRRVSRYGQQLIGRSTESLEGISVEAHSQNWGIFHPDGLTPADNADLPLTRAVQQGEVVTNEEWILRRPDGQQMVTLCNAGPIYNSNGEITGGVIAWRDISDRKRTEMALRQSEERYRTLFESVDQGFCICQMVLDENGQPYDYRFLEINPAFERMTGLEQAIGKTARELVPNLESFWVETYGRVALTGIPARFENHSEAMQRWFDVQAFRVGDPQSCCFGLLFTNITERKRAEAERERLLAKERAARQEAERVNRLKDDFLSALSHELRTPLNPILGWTKLLRSQRVAPENIPKALETIERNVRQQISLVNDLLDMSRVIQGKMQLDFHRVDLTLPLIAALETLEFTAQAKNITLDYIPSNSVYTYGDDRRLRQVFWNLLSNAIKFTPEGGSVWIAVRVVSDRQVQIQFTDTGIGIPSHFLPHIFEYFYQIEGGPTRSYGGLGLGLSIVRHLVELHGGTVTATSAGVGQGATFTVTLPLLDDNDIGDDAGTSEDTTRPSDRSAQLTRPEGVLMENDSLDQTRPSQPADSNESAPPTGGLTGVRIVLVDDEPDNLELLRFLLTEEGAIVAAFMSALEAFQSFRQFPPDLLISDIGMPDMNGYELLQKVRSLPSQSKRPIPAIALTAFAQQSDREKAIAAGFQAYLPKPVEPLQVIELVTQILKNDIA